jgi:hypothetical protein
VSRHLDSTRHRYYQLTLKYLALSTPSVRLGICNSVRLGKTDDERVQEIMKRVEANDAGAMCILGIVIIGREKEVCRKIRRGT